MIESKCTRKKSAEWRIYFYLLTARKIYVIVLVWQYFTQCRRNYKVELILWEFLGFSEQWWNIFCNFAFHGQSIYFRKCPFSQRASFGLRSMKTPRENENTVMIVSASSALSFSLSLSLSLTHTHTDTDTHTSSLTLLTLGKLRKWSCCFSFSFPLLRAQTIWKSCELDRLGVWKGDLNGRLMTAMAFE